VDAVADLADRVPVEVLAGALGVGRHPVGLVADVRQLAETIGRGAPATAASDAAATRVLAHVEHHPAGPVAAASVLYQAHDAAAALLTTTIVGRHERAPRRSAVVRTLRSAATDTDVAGTPVAAGALVALDLDATGLELGAGPHRCPGREVAEAIVAGVLDALDDRGYALLAGLVVLDEGRPLALPMEPRR
jgi:hypothetical protein